MSRLVSIPGVVLVVSVVAAAVGCRPQQPFYFFEDGDMSHYVGVATDIEYPDVQATRLEEVEQAKEPLTLLNPDPSKIWDLSLEEAVRNALTNSKVIRVLPIGAAQAPAQVPDNLLRQVGIPSPIATIYDPALEESNPRFGVEAALAAFDTQFTTSMFWEKTDTPQNVLGFVQRFRPNPFMQDLASFQAQLQKTAATGGTFAIRHNVQYELNNVAAGTLDALRRWPDDYQVNVEAEIRQPLLQGAGVLYNRIAGPGAIPGYNNGVMIARIQTDMSLAQFEANVRNLVFDTEKAYWNLYYAYRQLDALIAGRDSALQTWRQVHAKFVIGSRGGGAQDEAQARQQYFVFRAAVEDSLNHLYQAENALRYLMGLTASDGRLIRPSDEPTTARVSFDWCESHAEGLARSAELRQQKWIIKQRELELIAAKNYLLPRLDAVGRYRWRGIGNRLLGKEDELSVIGPGDPGMPYSAYESMLGGDYQEWMMGFELRVPLGFRKEMAGVRNAQLALTRERAILQEQELELSHQLAAAFRSLAGNYVRSQTNFNRRIAAENEVNAVRSAYETGAATLDLLLDAQRRLAEAESAYYDALVEYNKDIAYVHYRKGSLLEYNGIVLAEGPWPGKAYFDAQRRARARDAGLYLDYGFTKPRVVSRGPVEQFPGGVGVPGGDAPLGDAPLPQSAPSEEIALPEPEPADQAPAPPANVVPEPQEQTRRPDAAGSAVARNAAQGNTPAATRSAAVEKASYQQAVPPSVSLQHADHQWKSTRRTSTSSHEPVASPAPAEADRSASGWKRVQH